MNYWLHKLKYGPIFKFKKYLFTIKLYSLKAYNDFWESKIVQILTYIGLFRPLDYFSPIGIELWLSSQKDFDEKELNRMKSAHNLRLFKTRCNQHLFQKARCFGGKVGTFLGILVTHEDNYYIFMDEYGNKWYESCVGKLEFIND